MEMGIRHELHLINRPNKKSCMPLACYTMTNAEKSNFLQVLKNIKVPDGYSSNISRGVRLKDRKLYNLKSHDAHIMMQGILTIVLKASMHSRAQIRVVKAVSDLCSFFKGLCAKVLDPGELDKMEYQVVRTLCELEQLFPPSFFTVMVHLTIHLISEAKLGGPVHYRWMYPIERELEISKLRTIDDEVRSEIADAVMMDIIGPDKPGQALGYGTGVTKSKVTKLSLDLRISRKEGLKNQNRLLLEKLDSQGRKIESQNNQIKTMAKDLSDIRGEVNVLTTAFKELFVAGRSKDMFFQETYEEDVHVRLEEQQQQHQHNLKNLWQSLWQSDTQTPFGVQNQNHQVSQSSQGQATRQQRQQGQATRRPTKLDSMGAAGECYKHATIWLLGLQQDMQQQAI